MIEVIICILAISGWLTAFLLLILLTGPRRKADRIDNEDKGVYRIEYDQRTLNPRHAMARFYEIAFEKNLIVDKDTIETGALSPDLFYIQAKTTKKENRT